MLQDYRVYLTNIRNNLIQCGVDYPIKPMNSYMELFTAGMGLDEVLWYYSILAVSGSKDALQNYFIPLSSHYKEKMRQVFYQEFTEFVSDYRKLSVGSILLGDYSSPKGVEPKVFEDNEEIDLFEEDTPKVETVEEQVKEPEIPLEDIAKDIEEQIHPKAVSSMDFLKAVNEGKEEFTPHGICLDEIEGSVSEEDNLNKEGYTSHGIYLDELPDELEEINEEVDKDLKEGYVSHGIYLDELPESDLEEETPEGYCEHGVYLEDLPEESTNEEEMPEGYCEHGVYLEDLPEESSSEEGGIKYDENGFEIVEDEPSNDWVDEDFDDDLSYEGSEDDSSSIEDTNSVESTSQVVKKPTSTRDMSDTLQDITNDILTRGKRFIRKEVKKLKED